MSMTLQEALATDEVKQLLSNLIQEAVDEALSGNTLTEAVQEALPAAVDAEIEKRLPAIRESVKQEINGDAQVLKLHTEAMRLIEASPLKGAAKANLLEDYGIVESAVDDAVKPGRALALIEAEVDADGNVTKTAKAVLAEAIDADVKRARAVLRESAPSVPRAPGGGDATATSEDDAKALVESLTDSPEAARFRDAGLNPEHFGLAPQSTTTA